MLSPPPPGYKEREAGSQYNFKQPLYQSPKYRTILLKITPTVSKLLLHLSHSDIWSLNCAGLYIFIQKKAYHVRYLLGYQSTSALEITCTWSRILRMKKLLIIFSEHKTQTQLKLRVPRFLVTGCETWSARHVAHSFWMRICFFLMRRKQKNFCFVYLKFPVL